MNAFHICLVHPEGYAHALCFRETALLLKCSFGSLGLPCGFGVNSFDPARTNVILGYHLLKADERLRGCRYIPYQLEQLGEGNPWLNDNTWEVLRRAQAVWDYSESNIEFLAAEGIRASYLPIGYHPSLEIVPRCGDRDIDILFYGSVNERRKKVLDELLALAGPSVQVLNGVYGKGRDAAIARAKLVLNMHYYPTAILESVRVSYLLNNRCFVLSEESPENPYKELALCTARYDDLVQSCLGWLESPGEMLRRAEESHSLFRARFPMPALLGDLVNA